jgi:hypothetical protein
MEARTPYPGLTVVVLEKDPPQGENRGGLVFVFRRDLTPGYRLSRPAAAASLEPLPESFAVSNRHFDSTKAGVCVTVKRGLRKAVRSRRGPAS